MAVILFGGQKGGSGKTTAAVSFAAMLAGEGGDVLLVDADGQQSATKWNAIREKGGVSPMITCVSLFGDSLASQVRAMAPKYDAVVIDTRGSDGAELRSAMLVAEVIVTPTQTSEFDLFTFGTMDQLVEQARGFNPELRALCFVNCAPTNDRGNDAEGIREALAELRHYRLLDSMLSYRKAFKRTARYGMSVTEFDEQDEKASAEMRALFAEVTQ